MKVSTRGRYALRLMIDLAQHNDDGYISLKEISARQDITVRYLEQIIAILLKAGFVQSFRGKSGGYRLSRHPREYTTEDILKLTEGSLLPLSCTASQNSPCPRASSCATLPFWYLLVFPSLCKNVCWALWHGKHISSVRWSWTIP